MYKHMILVFLIILSMNYLMAQDEYYDEVGDSAYQQTQQTEPMTDLSPYKYPIIGLSIVVLIGIYFWLLSVFPKLLEQGQNPLYAAATQFLRFSGLAFLILIIMLLALNNFTFSNFGDFFTSNITLIAIVLGLWFILFIISISYKGKGSTK